MTTNLLFQDAASFATPMLAIFAVDIATAKNADPMLALLTTSDAVTDAAAKVLASGEFKATSGETLLLHNPNGLKAERLLIVGLGKVKALSVDEIRKGAGTAVRAAKPRGVRGMAIAFPEDHALSDEHLDNLPCVWTARALVEGAELAEMDYDTYKSDRKDQSDTDADGDCKRGGEDHPAGVAAGLRGRSDRSRSAELYPLAGE